MAIHRIVFHKRRGIGTGAKIDCGEGLRLPVKKPSAHTKLQKELILKALTDSTFRKGLVSAPEAALGKKRLSPEQRREVALVVAAVKGIEAQIGALADELLCANTCGIA